MDTPTVPEAVLRAVGDFLTFRTFISPGVLAIAYYVGAVSIPMLAWLIARRLKVRLAAALDEGRWPGAAKPPALAWARVLGLSFIAFVAMEIGWRMLFEFLLANFQIREALLAQVG